MQHILANLNQQQRIAVKECTHPLLVIAGAGSGKTKVITTKICYLISELKINPNNIVAITFTNKSAKEMAERVTTMLNDLHLSSRGLTISTFHSLGLKILREEAQLLGYKKNFSILDSYDAAKIINDIINSTDKNTVKATQSKISLCKNQSLTPEKLVQNASNDEELVFARVYQTYQDTLKTYHCVDFDDLINLPVELLTKHPEIHHKYKQKIKYLLVDEYQDTNMCQYQLIRLLVGDSGRFTTVGDDDQSIYAWRGANSENLNILQQDFPHLQVVKLEQNYRSTITILKAANNLIKHNPKVFDKKLWSDYGMGNSIKINSYSSDEAEADAIARKIMIQTTSSNTKYSEFAVLYRGNHQSKIIEQALRNYKIPYQVSGGQSFFEKPEIKDICSYLRLLANEDDDVAFVRAITTPKKGIGATTMDKLSHYAGNRHISLFEAMFEHGFADICPENTLDELLNFGSFINNFQYRMEREDAGVLINELVNAIRYENYLYEQDDVKVAEKKWANVLNLAEWITNQALKKEKKLAEIIQTISLISILEGKDKDDIDAVKLITIHASKGLEYPHVFIISCEEGIIPHTESINNDQVEEERRLMYVAITRAKYQLDISYCNMRKKNGVNETREKSRFLNEIGNENIIDESLTKTLKIKDNQELKDRLEAIKSLLNN